MEFTRCAQHRHRTSEQGFTLTELMVVSALILLMTGIASFVFFQQRESARLNSASSTLSTVLRSARQGAITKGVNHRVVIEVRDDLGNDQVERYWVERPNRTSNRGYSAFQGLPPSVWATPQVVTDPEFIDDSVDLASLRVEQSGGQPTASPPLPGGGVIRWYVEFNTRGVVPSRYIVNNRFTDPNNALSEPSELMVFHLIRANEQFDYNKDQVPDGGYDLANIRNANFGLDKVGIDERGKVATVLLLTKTGRTRSFGYGRYDPWSGNEIPSSQ